MLVSEAVTNPVGLTVMEFPAVMSHVPPAGVAVNVRVSVWQRSVSPAMAVGATKTSIWCVLLQLFASAKNTVAVPTVSPTMVAEPAVCDSMAMRPERSTLHVPPPIVALLSVSVSPLHSWFSPTISMAGS